MLEDDDEKALGSCELKFLRFLLLELEGRHFSSFEMIETEFFDVQKESKSML
jgi:hypothetical protein